jgi:uncharacterized protein (TIGR02453 family)
MKGTVFPGFPAAAMAFLAELARNNDRAWFAENKARYEALVREPALDFVQAMGQPIADVAPRFVAIPKKTGGSLMRPYRDTRFSKDKTPYKTNVGIQFRHEFARDVHAPGFYVHIHPEEVFLAVGCWRPASDPLRAIRERIVDHPDTWTMVRDDRGFRRRFELAGDALKRAPRGFDRDHPLADDLRRKDFVAVRNLDPAVVSTPRLQREAVTAFAAAAPFMRFLCEATGAPWD